MAFLFSLKIQLFSSAHIIETPSHFLFHFCFIWFSSHSVSCSFTFHFPYVHFCLFLVPKMLHQMMPALIQAFNYSTLAVLCFLHLVSLTWDFLAWRLNNTYARQHPRHTHSHKHILSLFFSLKPPPPNTWLLIKIHFDIQ